MKLIDVEALRNELDEAGGIVPSWIAWRIDSAPRVSCEECVHYRTHHDMCHTCFGANLFERRTP